MQYRNDKDERKRFVRDEKKNRNIYLSQSSRMCAPRVKFGSSPISLIRSNVYSITSSACIPPCGIIGPQVMVSSRE